MTTGMLYWSCPGLVPTVDDGGLQETGGPDGFAWGSASRGTAHQRRITRTQIVPSDVKEQLVSRGMRDLVNTSPSSPNLEFTNFSLNN